MTKLRWIGLVAVLIGSGISILWGTALNFETPGGVTDLKSIYYPARCLLEHRDPYKDGEILRAYQADGGEIPSAPPVASRVFRRSVGTCANLPPSFLLTLPLTFIGWKYAQVVWLALIAVSYTLAAFLIWDIAGQYEPGISTFLVLLLLVNSEVLFLRGNTAGLVVSLCVIAVWCFVRDRFVWAGVACLALSLAIKPHDSGFVWLYFLLAGGTYRKNALKTLAVTAVFALAAAAWVWHVAPHWMQELHSNLQVYESRGDLNDPGPMGIDGRFPDAIVDLQAVISVFKDDPTLYNPVSYLLSGLLLVLWSVKTLRARVSPAGTWLALAAISALSMLPNYHRDHDAKLLLLTIPACAMLWTEGGFVRWTALAVSAAGFLVSGDVALATLLFVTRSIHPSAASLGAQIRTVLVTRPAPLIMLMIGVFYLWVFLRRDASGTRSPEVEKAKRNPPQQPSAVA